MQDSDNYETWDRWFIIEMCIFGVRLLSPQEENEEAAQLELNSKLARIVPNVWAENL